MKIVYVSDFSLQEVNGGAELCDSAAIETLKKNNFEVEFIKCINLVEVSKENFYIFSNIAQLRPEVISSLIEKNVTYWIYLHDHSYCVYRNPFRHNKQLICNCFNYNSLVHMFYFFAKAILCQTSFHANIVNQNVYCNAISVGSNLWREDEIELLKKCKEKSSSNGKYIIFESPYAHKNTKGAIEYAQKNNLEYELVSGLKWEQYIEKLSSSEGIIFFPILAESASRLVFEAKALNKKVITNKLVGYTWESWWKEENIDFERIIEDASEKILNELRKEIPKISVFCTTYNAEKYIDAFLKNMLEFNFESYEVVIFDGCSDDSTVKRIKDFIDINKCQKIIRLYESSNKIDIYKGWNKALSKCRSSTVINMNVDDRFSSQTLSKLHEFMTNNEADFVYCNSDVTNKPNETFEKHSKITELLWPEYDRNLLKKRCFGGHFPMWRKNLLLKSGLFDEMLKSASDWDRWIAFSENGAKFKKLNKTLGLYYHNPEGMSTSANGMSNINAIESAFVLRKWNA